MGRARQTAAWAAGAEAEAGGGYADPEGLRRALRLVSGSVGR